MASSPILVVDLDETLVKTDLLYESLLRFLRQQPFGVGALLKAARRGPLGVKEFLAKHVPLQPEGLPYDEKVLERIHKAKELGQKVVLASASPAAYVASVSSYLGVFDAWHGSQGAQNLKGKVKLALLRDPFGPDVYSTDLCRGHGHWFSRFALALEFCDFLFLWARDPETIF